MLTFTNKQMQTFEEAAEKHFLQRMILHVRKHFPDNCKENDDEDLLKILTKGAERAKYYGITEKRDICKYFNFMFSLGYEFDNNNTYPWAKEILNDKTLTNGSSKIIRLSNAVCDHLDSMQQNYS